MRNSYLTPVREYSKGMGEAVADRTINRKKEDGTKETWADVAFRVAKGNASLAGDEDKQTEEFYELHHHLRQASVLLSGRHLQHGDENQRERPGNVFTNCSTAGTSFLSFALLLSGSGVGRSYEDALMLVNWAYLPQIVTVIEGSHKDVQSGEIRAIDNRSARHLYTGCKIHEYKVEDSREGWAKAIEKMETMAYFKKYHNDVFILDFSDVRPRNSPIRGMQNRPASGPGPLMDAINNIAKLRGCVSMAPWRQTMYVDHYMAECVLVGGARRAARMATKEWTDESVFDFIEVKRGGFLWSSNNSVCVDREFWEAVFKVTKDVKAHSLSAEILCEAGFISSKELHAYKVFNKAVECSYYDGTGEPGFINQDRLTNNDEGLEETYLDGEFVNTPLYSFDVATKEYTRKLVEVFMTLPYRMIVNPCAEIALAKLFGLCIIGDVVPFYSSSDRDAESAFRVTTRALIRVNTMDFLYNKEVKRTNRIGVGLTGIHEYAWARFGLGWKDLVNEEKSIEFWKMMSRFARVVQEEAREYSEEMGLVMPHTLRCVKPSGSVSKLTGITEGAHLPAMREYLRWVQFRNDDPLVKVYKDANYPIQHLATYSGTTIVGFPTVPLICTLEMEDALVTASEATPEEQYSWLRLLEKWWIRGMEEDGETPLEERGNSVSYTLKYDPKELSFEKFKDTLLKGQSTIRCCSIMPKTDTTAYEYVPEQSLTKHEFELISQAIIDQEVEEDINFEHLDCSSGACPITFLENK